MRLSVLTRVLVLCLGVLLSGCHPAPTAAKPSHYYYVDSDSANAADKGNAFEDPSKVSQNNGATKADLAKLGKAQQDAKTLMKKDPSSGAKANFVNLTVDLATKTMYCAELNPHEKYAGALKLFREALSIDPKNKQAKDSADTIVSIYHQMGRPVPE